MKRMLMAVLAVAVAVTFSAPAFADKEKKEDKKGGTVVYSDDKKEEKKGGHATDGDDKKEEKKGATERLVPGKGLLNLCLIEEQSELRSPQHCRGLLSCLTP